MPKKGPLFAELCTGAGFIVALLIELILKGMKPWFTPDTGGYLAYHPWPDCLGQARIPLYGWLVDGVVHVTGGYGLIPWLQFLFFFVCAIGLLRSLRRIVLDETVIAALGVAIGLSNVVLIWCRAIMPTVPAVSFLFLAITGIVSLTRGMAIRDYALVSFFVMLAWLLDPGLLSFILILPAMLWSLSAGQATLAKFRKSVALLVACAVPFVAVSSVRAAEVGNFNIVSFGGFQMSGMAALMLSPATIDRLPLQFRPLATAVLQGRTAQEQAGTTIATPENSIGARSFGSEAIGYFDILARTHDSVLYGVVAKQRQPAESWVAFNNRLQHFAIATIRAAPVDYAAWVLGAVARLIGHALVMNPAFLLPALAVLAWFAVAPILPAPEENITPLLTIVLWYTLGTSLLTVLVTFRAQRYIDVSGLMLPALPIYALLLRILPRR